ncbi:MAG TPA: ABC transporter substrate-binding protein [Flexivirga sp.]|uniref:ABC transporter substrate-binding protein n=1 Tax=Flexivirga sp. TaxID=1962927 RepID=UPI002CD8DFF7|nr:ABC transporter substrate-binding protein [Flexivirga sp.]HWC22790.1 ABC transporter substrate-binding protein [Flexivirga sp.]
MKARYLAAPIGAALALALSGCSDPSSGGGTSAGGSTPSAAAVSAGAKTPAVTVDKKARAALPASIRDKGELVAVMSESSAPLHYVDTKTNKISGLDADLARALGQALGLKVRVVGTSFDAIIPGLQASKYDIAVSQMSPSKDRLKVLDFVDYFKSGSGIGVAGGNPKKVTKDLCGFKVGDLKGSFQNTTHVPEMNKKCAAAGKPKIQEKTYPDMQTPLLSLAAGRIDAVYVDGGVLGYAIKQGAKVQALGYTDVSPVSIGFKKGAKLQTAIKGALQSLTDQGVYRSTLSKWGQADGAITDFAFDKAQ